MCSVYFPKNGILNFIVLSHFQQHESPSSPPTTSKLSYSYVQTSPWSTGTLKTFREVCHAHGFPEECSSLRLLGKVGADREGSLRDGQMDAAGVRHRVSKDLEGERLLRWCSASQSSDSEVWREPRRKQVPFKERPGNYCHVFHTRDPSSLVLQTLRSGEDRVHSLSSR